MNFNQVNLAGHLTRDPELSYTQNQTAVANFDIATNYKRGQTEETCFVRCSAFGNIGENIVKYFTKGMPIFISGRLQQNKWKNQDGSSHSRIQIVVNTFRFVGSNRENQQSNNVPYAKNQENEGDVFK